MTTVNDLIALPCSLTPKQKHVAQMLLAEGFWWVKEWDEETIAFLEPAGKEWQLGSSCCSAGIIDAFCNGALFCKEFALHRCHRCRIRAD